MSQENNQKEEDALLDELLEDIISPSPYSKDFLKNLLESESDCV